MVIFERSTFLAVAHYTRVGCESGSCPSKVSTYFKHFKLACLKGNTVFCGVTITSHHLTIVLMPLTQQTVILFVHDNFTPPGVALANAESCVREFAHVRDESSEAAALFDVL